MISKQFQKTFKLGKFIEAGIVKNVSLRNQGTKLRFSSMNNIRFVGQMSFQRSYQPFNFVNKYNFSSSSQSENVSEAEKQIEEFNSQFDKLYDQKQYDQCLEILRQLIVLKEEKGFDIRYEVQQTGHVLIKNKRVQEGLDVLYDLKSQLESLNIVDNLIIAKIAENISKGEMIKGNLAKSIQILDEVIQKLEKVVSYDDPSLYDMLARNYSQRGNIYALEKSQKRDYIGEYQKAKDIYEKFEELVPEQKKSYAVILQKMANALINKNEIDLAETNIVKSKQLWMELEKFEPIDPNHFSTLITFGVVELYKGRVTPAMKVINQCKLDLEKKIKLDKAYSNSYMATITIIAGIFKSNPAAKQALEKVKIDFDEGLKILEGSDDDGPTKILFEEYKNIRSQLFD